LLFVVDRHRVLFFLLSALFFGKSHAREYIMPEKKKKQPVAAALPNQGFSYVRRGKERVNSLHESHHQATFLEQRLQRDAPTLHGEIRGEHRVARACWAACGRSIKKTCLIRGSDSAGDGCPGPARPAQHWRG
jgi:hypothetical protein